MSTTENSPDWLIEFNRRRERFDRAGEEHFAQLDLPYSALAEAIRYAMAAGGKRLRPILVLETSRVCGGSENAAMPAALAIECVHAFSLVHDDLPAMDDDDFRRGRPTTHRRFGEALAILAGDWLLAHAFAIISGEAAPIPASRGEKPQSRTPSASDGSLLDAPSHAATLAAELARGTLAMIAGQAADIEGEARGADVQTVAFIHAHKTAALFESACRMGAICSGAPRERVDQMGRFGRRLGLAFQIADDLLDAAGTPERAGKRVGKDAAAAKQTYPAVFGIDESRERARAEVEAALREIDNLGSEARLLRGLAEFAVNRTG